MWHSSPPALNLFQHQGLSSESVLHIRWPKFQSFSFSISPSNEYSGLISFRIDWLDLLAVQRLSRVFSNTTVQKHQFFGAQPSLLSNSHIHTCLLEELWLWLDEPLLAKWCLWFLICCLGWSQLFFQGASIFQFHGCSHCPQWFWSPVPLFPLFPLLFTMKWWDRMPWS